jgi:hypothetical protein
LDQVSKSGRQLSNAPQFREDKEVAMAAVTQWGLALVWCSASLQDDKDVVMQAVAQDGTSLRFASRRLQADIDVCSTATRQTAQAMASASLSMSPSMVRLAVQCHGVAWLSNTIGTDKDDMMIARTLENRIDEVDVAQHFVACWPPDVVAAQAFKCGMRTLCFRILHLLAASKHQQQQAPT